MPSIADYYRQIYITAISHPKVKSFQKLREEIDVSGSVGVYRYRITLINGDLVELTERIVLHRGKLIQSKYRFHWQDSNGCLRKRWDNAPHHPELNGFPHHIHEGSEENVRSHPPIDAMEVLNLILQDVG
jgi:hypothetical protein